MKIYGTDQSYYYILPLLDNIILAHSVMIHVDPDSVLDLLSSLDLVILSFVGVIVSHTHTHTLKLIL